MLPFLQGLASTNEIANDRAAFPNSLTFAKLGFMKTLRLKHFIISHYVSDLDMEGLPFGNNSELCHMNENVVVTPSFEQSTSNGG